jgi:predicted Zn-dependent protease
MSETITQQQLSRLVDAGLAATHAGQVAGARALFENLLRYKPGFAPAQIGLGFTHLVVGDYARAEEILSNDVLARNPADAEALALLGLAYTLQQKTDEARAVFARISPEASAHSLAQAIVSYEAA